jgi:gluconolactonase
MPEPLLSIDTFNMFVEGLDHPEGIAWGRDGNLYAGGEAGQIYRIAPDGSSVKEIANTGGFILGLCMDADNTIYACDLGHQAVMRITQNGDISPYSTGAPDRPFVAPNYPVFDDRGNLYVSSSGGFRQYSGCLFLVRPGGETQVISTKLTHFPNGMALSADGKYLYVVLSNVPGVLRVPVREDATVGPPEPVVTLPKHVPDGVAFDVEGNLYISCYTPDVIYRLTPDGVIDVLAEDWEGVTFATPTNIAFGGPDLKTLFVASLSRWHLTKGPMPIAGLPLRYPEL